MSVVESITVTLYRVKPGLRPKGWRKGRPRRQKRLAYRDAAWAKLRLSCKCIFPASLDDGTEIRRCRYHDKQYRVGPAGAVAPWDDQPCFEPPAVWGLPRSHDAGYWDYGRAVAYRLARFYAHLDVRSEAAQAVTLSGGGRRP